MLPRCQRPPDTQIDERPDTEIEDLSTNFHAPLCLKALKMRALALNSRRDFIDLEGCVIVCRKSGWHMWRRDQRIRSPRSLDRVVGLSLVET